MATRFAALTAAAALAAMTALAAPAMAADQASFDAAYAKAEAARKGAAEVGYEWRDTGKMLRKARSLAEKGDFDGAVKLANEARFEGERAQAQAAEQAKVWQSFVLK